MGDTKHSALEEPAWVTQNTRLWKNQPAALTDNSGYSDLCFAFSVVAVAVAVVLLLVACRLCLRVGGASAEAERLYVFCFWSKVRTHARVARKQLKWERVIATELHGSNSVARNLSGLTLELLGSNSSGSATLL